MINLNFKIKPIITIENSDLWIFTGEIHQMPFSIIEDGILSCERVMSGKYLEMSWGLEVSELLIHKETSTLEYHGKFVAEIPTIEIYEMLKKYKKALESFDCGA